MKIRITGKKLKSYDPGGVIGFPKPQAGDYAINNMFAKDNAEEIAQQQKAIQQQPVASADPLGMQQYFAEKNPDAAGVSKPIATNQPKPMTKWEQFQSNTDKKLDGLMDKTFGNPFSLYNMAGFASNIVDGFNNRRDLKTAERKERDNYSTMGLYAESDPEILSRGIRAVSGTMRNRDLPDQIGGNSSMQGMMQKYYNPYRAEMGLNLTSGGFGPGDTLSEFMPTPSISSGAGPVPPAPKDPLAFTPPYSTEGIDDLRSFIGKKESGGDYGALPKDKKGHLVSSAVGKYQFLWGSHKDWISKVTGIEDKEAFRKNPEAQEKAFEYWDQTVLTPNAMKIQKNYGIQGDLNKIKYMVHFAGPKGAEDYFSGKKDTVDGFGMTTSKLWKRMEEGGQQTDNNSNMKIRITGAPEQSESMKIRITGGPEKMEYGGQSGYGLDLGQRNVYADMNESSTESMSPTLTEKDANALDQDENYVIMAEDKETVVSDIDGDGGLEFQNISGDPHSAASGGTKITNKQLNPNPEKNGEGAFIYSQKLKVKDPAILKKFGVTGNKASFAEISKRFNMMNEKKVLDDPNADPLSKHTASLGKQFKEAKLQQLAEVQEMMKGNPQGNPDLNKSLATMARGGMIYDFMDYAEDGIQKKVDPPPGYRERTPQLNAEREMADFSSVEDIDRFYRRQGYTGGADIGKWQNWMAQQAQSNPRMKSRLTNYLRSVPLTAKAYDDYGKDAKETKLTDDQMISQFQDGKWDFRAPKFWNPEKVEVPRRPLPPLTTPNIIGKVPPNITPKVPETPVGPKVPGKPEDPYLPYNGIQMANTLHAASKPVKGYFDKAFVPEYTGTQAMFDDVNYDPLLSANATRNDYMNQFGNAQAARATGTYNPDLNQGLVGETDRVRRNNLSIGNQTLQMNNQMYNQNSMMRGREMDQVRENNIRTREQMDIAKNLKYNDTMQNYGKMVNDHTTMMKYNLMNPQFAVSGRLWDKFNFTKGKPLGGANAGSSGGGMFPSMAEWLKSKPGSQKMYDSGNPEKMMELEKAYDTFIRSQQAMMMRSGSNVRSNMNNASMQDLMDRD